MQHVKIGSLLPDTKYRKYRATPWTKAAVAHNPNLVLNLSAVPSSFSPESTVFAVTCVVPHTCRVPPPVMTTAEGGEAVAEEQPRVSHIP